MHADHQSALERQIAAWRRGLADEVEFWRRWLATGGLEWPEDFRARLRGGYDVAGLLRGVPVAEGRRPVLVDVGSGPISTLSRRAGAAEVEVHAVDPLARFYGALLAEHGITPSIPTRFGTAEDLSAFFPRDFADVVHCNNALDHSFDPMRGIEEMLEVSRPTGLVHLAHRRNEAEFEGYTGFHQWNFDLADDGRFVIWDKARRIDVSEALRGLARCEPRLDGDFLVVRIRKDAHGADALSQRVAARRRDRVADMAAALVSSAALVASAQAEALARAPECEALRSRLRALEAELAAARAQAEERGAALAAARAEAEALRASWSWRITAPLRRLRRLVGA